MGSRLQNDMGPNLYAYWGDKIAEADGFMSVPIHASASGTVVDIGLYPHPTGEVREAVRWWTAAVSTTSPTSTFDATDTDNDGLTDSQERDAQDREYQRERDILDQTPDSGPTVTEILVTRPALCSRAIRSTSRRLARALGNSRVSDACRPSR